MTSGAQGAPSRPRIGVVDHGAGNLVSISQGLDRVGAEAVVVTQPRRLASCDGIVLPGVGSTGGVMAGIEAGGFADALRTSDRPLLGICVGMQVLFDTSDEDGARCLGLVAGTVRRLTGAPTLPHIGWNDLTVQRSNGLFDGLDEPIVYFVHSYAPQPQDPAVVTATAHHGERFVAAVAAGRVLGVQFHPERSGPVGLRVLSRFVAMCRDLTRVA